MQLTVIIPTRGRRDQLRACLSGLVHQTCDRDCFEVLVGVDGRDEGEAEVFNRVIGESIAGRVVEAGGGPAATRNAIISQARGKVLLLLNDDVVPDPALVATHLEAQQRGGDGHAMILGRAPWAVQSPDRLFDRLIRETSMVFFYDQMDSSEPNRDWGFRHAWTLNLSVSTENVRSVGGFCERMRRPVYEDLELGWRLQSRFAMPVLYRPEAVVTHEHRYEPLAFLERDAVLGHQAWRLAEVSPECARAMFGVDLHSDEEVEYSRQFLQRHEVTAQRHVSKFLHLAEMPATAVEGPYASAIIDMLYDHGLMLRRYLWRLGHVAASAGHDVDHATSWLSRIVAHR